MNCFKNYKLLTNDMMKEKEQPLFMLRCLGFVFDINFKKSFEIIKEKNIVNLKCDEIYKKTKNKDIKIIQDILNKYIDERIDKCVR